MSTFQIEPYMPDDSGFRITPVSSPEEINAVADTARIIWQEHFTPIIGEAQVDYMLSNMQSAQAITGQIAVGYIYFKLEMSGTICGYCAVQPQGQSLFLSKIYIKKEYRGLHLSTKTFVYIQRLCRINSLGIIRLTCNKYNSGSLAVYKHLGFEIVREEKTDIGSGFFMDDFILEKTVR